MLGYLFLLETYHTLSPFLLLDQTSILEKQPLLLPSLICRRWQPYQTDDTFSMQSSPNISHPLPPLAAKSPILLVACRCRGDALSLENAKVMIYEASFVGSPNFSCCLLRLSIAEFYLLHHFFSSQIQYYILYVDHVPPLSFGCPIIMHLLGHQEGT